MKAEFTDSGNLLIIPETKEDQEAIEKWMSREDEEIDVIAEREIKESQG